jgi:3-isopropylmalate/(R)-2-methylmalate dehydratase large subunit
MNNGSMNKKKQKQTMFDKIWDAHFVARRLDGRDMIYVDRHVLHDLHAPHAFEKLERANRHVRRADLTFSMQDHTVATKPGRDENTNPDGAQFQRAMREGSNRHAIRLFDLDDPEQGISHVVAPELGLVLPGATHAVPDSHACTVGGIGALGLGCGTSELEHILATQTIALKRPKNMRIRLDGRLDPFVTAKDVALRILAQFGTSFGRGYAIEYAGDVARAMPIEARMTLCNLTIEMGSRSGFIAPDEKTFAYLAGRPYAPQGRDWDEALAHWRHVPGDEDAIFDGDLTLDCNGLAPQISWGTDQSQTIGLDEIVPLLAHDADARAKMERALAYMGLEPGKPIAGVKVDRVFIGSCTNARMSDLRAAAALVKGKHAAKGVTAMVVPGSTSVKREAEREGLDRIFKDAGFFWGESGCSMCAGGNGDRGRPQERVVSTTNRNFEGRQGKGVRTHLASPEVAAACALTGVIADPRRIA